MHQLDIINIQTLYRQATQGNCLPCIDIVNFDAHWCGSSSGWLSFPQLHNISHLMENATSQQWSKIPGLTGYCQHQQEFSTIVCWNVGSSQHIPVQWPISMLGSLVMTIFSDQSLDRSWLSQDDPAYQTLLRMGSWAIGYQLLVCFES